MSDTLIIAGNTYTNVAGFKATDNNNDIKTYIRPEGTKNITANGNNIDVANYATVSVNVQGVSSAISVVDTTDAAGGTIRTITAVDISDTTAVANDVAQGKYFYTADGTKTIGTATVGGFSVEDYLNHNIVQDTVTWNGTNINKVMLYGNTIHHLILPNVTEISYSPNGFENIGLVSLYAPNLTYLTRNASIFANNPNLESVDFPKLKSFGYNDGAFQNCTSIVSAYFPEVTDAGGGVFQGCTSLKTAVYPKTVNFYTSSFRGCTSLEGVDGLLSTGINSSTAFYGCTKLTKLIIRKDGVATLANINNFQETPYANGGIGGEIYVPSAQISAYRAATNWSTLDGYGTVTWVAIEGSYYETHYVDGTEIPND